VEEFMPYLTFELEDGTKVNIEASDMQKNAPGLIPSGRGESADKAPIPFGPQVAGVKKMAAALVKEFREGQGDQPSDVDISFGMKASGELGGFLISRTGGEAVFSVTLRWHAKDQEDEKKSE
jgi:hypothetical protein